MVKSRRTIQQQIVFVKGRIVSSGIKLGNLAVAAGMSNGNLSKYISGGLTYYPGQEKIFLAYRKLTGIRVSFADFWGPLASSPKANRKRIA